MTAARDAHDREALKLKRKLEKWLGDVYESTKLLLQIYYQLIPKLVHDLEIEAGLRVLDRIAREMVDRLEPQTRKYGEDVREGRRRALILRGTLFPPEGTHEASYEVLEVLQVLHVYLAHIQNSLTALVPNGQAVWDDDFVTAVNFGMDSIGRMTAYLGRLHSRSKSGARRPC